LRSQINTIEEKYYIRIGSLGYGFQVTASWRLKQAVQSVQLEFPCRHCMRQTSWTVLSSTTSDWGCLPWRPTKRPSRAVWRCRSTDEDFVYGSFSSYFSGILEKLVSRWDEGPTAWLAHSPDLNPLYFYLRGHFKSIVYAKVVSDIQVS
jgi:hypothetical protein